MKLASLLGRFAVAVVLLWFVVANVDVSSLGDRLGGIDPWMTFLGTAMLLMVPLLGGQRWQLVLRALGGPGDYGRPLSMFWIGAMFGQVLPASVGGDVIRVFLCWRKGYGVQLAVNSVLLERLFLFVVLLVLVVTLYPLWIARADIPIPGWMPWMLGFATVGGLALVATADLITGWQSTWRWVRALRSISADTRRILAHHGRLSGVVLNSIVNHSAIALSGWFFAQALAMQVDVVDCLVLMPPVLLLSSLPISFAGWGVREGAVVVLFGAASGDPTSALMMSVLIGLASIVTSLPGLLLWMVAPDRGKTIPDIAVLDRERPESGVGGAAK